MNLGNGRCEVSFARGGMSLDPAAAGDIGVNSKLEFKMLLMADRLSAAARLHPEHVSRENHADATRPPRVPA